MSLAKDFVLAVEEVLIPIAIQAGALERCFIHSHCLIDQGDDEAQRRAYAMATNAWKDGQIGGSREDVMDEMHHLLTTTPDQCTHCAATLARD